MIVAVESGGITNERNEMESINSIDEDSLLQVHTADAGSQFSQLEAMLKSEMAKMQKRSDEFRAEVQALRDEKSAEVQALREEISNFRSKFLQIPSCESGSPQCPKQEDCGQYNHKDCNDHGDCYWDGGLWQCLLYR